MAKLFLGGKLLGTPKTTKTGKISSISKTTKNPLGSLGFGKIRFSPIGKVTTTTKNISFKGKTAGLKIKKGKLSGSNKTGKLLVSSGRLKLQ